jgi:hypothetical protein
MLHLLRRVRGNNGVESASAIAMLNPNISGTGGGTNDAIPDIGV